MTSSFAKVARQRRIFARGKQKILRRRYRRAIWRAAYPLLCSTAAIGLNIHMAAAGPLTQATLTPQFSPGRFGLVGGGSLTATPGGGTVSGNLIGGGAITLGITAADLVTITDSGQALSATFNVADTAGNPADDTQGWLDDTGNPKSGTISLLQPTANEQVFFGPNVLTIGTLNFTSLLGNTSYVFNDGANSTINNVAVLGPTHLNYIDNAGTGDPAFVEAVGYIGIPITLNGNLTETDGLGDAATLSWSGQQILGNGNYGPAIDPPVIQLGGSEGGWSGLWQTACLGLGCFAAALLLQRRHKRRKPTVTEIVAADRARLFLSYSGFGQ
jgi:hypothetical protein